MLLALRQLKQHKQHKQHKDSIMVDIAKLKEMMFDVVGAIYEVHKELGAGLNESCYQEGLEIQLLEDDIPFNREMSFRPYYHGRLMDTSFRIDFLCKDCVVVECKAVSELNATHRAQLFNYMRLLQKPCGILANFSLKYVQVERYLYDADKNEILSIEGRLLHQLRF